MVKSISAFTGKPLGLTKNCFDAGNIVIAAALSLLTMGKIVDIHIGSLLAMLGVGRVIALFNRLFPEKSPATEG